MSRLLFAGALLACACGVGQIGSAQQPGPAAAGAAAVAPVVPPQPAAAAQPVPAAASQATVTGSVAGHGLQPAVALWGLGRTAAGQPMLAVKISDQPDECARMAAGTIRAGSNSLWLRVVADSFAGAPVTVPAVATDGTSSATLYALDATCNNLVNDDAAWATGGQIAMTLAADDQVTGTFSLTMGSAGTPLSGSFTAVACPAMGALIAEPDEVRSCQ